MVTAVRTPDPAKLTYISKLGSAITQAVSRRLPTTAAMVRGHGRSCGIRGGQSGARAGFLRVLRFPLPILIPPTAPHSSSSIIRGWYNRPISGRLTKWTQSHSTPKHSKARYISKIYCSTKCQDRCINWRYLPSFEIGTEVLYIT
jgi:hypothetical protein